MLLATQDKLVLKADYPWRDSMRLLIFLCTLLMCCAGAAEPVLMVKYIGNNSGVKEDYYLELIDAALKTTEPKFGAYKVNFVREQLTSQRKHELLVSGERLNIDRLVGFHNNAGPRSVLLQIKMPLLRGFMGYRIPLIRRDSQAAFDRVNTLDDLRKIPLGLGKGWEGYIYQKNGFNLTEPINFETLLKMLAGGRYDFVPLSAIEIEDYYQIDNQTLDSLVPENHILIHTALPNYFYVSPNAPELATRLNAGFKQLQKNGGMNKIFDKYFLARLQKLNLPNRKIIEIPNPEDDGSLGRVDHKLLKVYSSY